MTLVTSILGCIMSFTVQHHPKIHPLMLDVLQTLSTTPLWAPPSLARPSLAPPPLAPRRRLFWWRPFHPGPASGAGGLGVVS